MNEDENLRAAVRELRKITGLNQGAFAARIGKSFQMVRVYETETAPSGTVLGPLVLLAVELGRNDLAQLFQARLIADLGEDVARALKLKFEHEDTEPMNVPSEMRGLVEWMLELFAKEGTLEQELMKQTLRELGQKRTSLTNPKRKKNAS